MASPIRVGISSCLLGEKVRYDGGHKHEPLLVETFGRVVEWVPVCPELEMGLGVPREPIQLVRRAGEVQMIGVTSGVDRRRDMRDYLSKKLDALELLDLCGYIFKAGSPSCGLREVPVYDSDGTAISAGRGLFAEALVARFPNLPVEDERRLHDPNVREEFLRSVLAYARTRTHTP